MRIFVAGASGAIGRPLVRQLVERGHDVVGMTRTPAKVSELAALGAQVVVCDAMDTAPLREEVLAAQPEVVVDQLTDLPQRVNVFRFKRFYDRQTPLKRAASPTLLRAAVESGAAKHIVQSVAFIYAPGQPGLRTEDDPLYHDAPAPWDEALPPFFMSEAAVVDEPSLDGIVLRYGFFCGPGTHYGPDGSIADEVRRRHFPIVGDGGGINSFIHVEDGATATVAAIESGPRGIYNIVDDTPLAVRDWAPGYAKALGAKSPRHVPRWMARISTGALLTYLSTELPGASNAKAKAVLGWSPARGSIIDGIRQDTSAPAVAAV
jgi:nucleoside-diphosphate-sugar epimerase